MGIPRRRPELVPAFEAPKLPALAFVRRARGRHRRAVHALQAPKLDFLRRGRRRQVLVQAPRIGLGHMALGEDSHGYPLRAAEWARDQDLVCRSENAIRLRRLAVDRNLATLAGALGLGARPEQAGDIEPDVEPNVFDRGDDLVSRN